MTCPKASGWGSGFRVYLDPPNYPLEIPQVPTIKGHKGSFRGYFGGVLVGLWVQGVRGFSFRPLVVPGSAGAGNYRRAPKACRAVGFFRYQTIVGFKDGSIGPWLCLCSFEDPVCGGVDLKTFWF